jgi:hypothetical protein
VIECFALSHTTFWIITGLLITSEALGKTKLVKANGVLSLLLDTLEYILRTMRRIFFK